MTDDFKKKSLIFFPWPTVHPPLSVQRLASSRTWTPAWTPATTSTSTPVGVGWRRTSSPRPAPGTTPLTSCGTSWRLYLKVRRRSAERSSDETDRPWKTQEPLFILFFFFFWTNWVVTAQICQLKAFCSGRELGTAWYRCLRIWGLSFGERSSRYLRCHGSLAPCEPGVCQQRRRWRRGYLLRACVLGCGYLVSRLPFRKTSKPQLWKKS